MFDPTEATFGSFPYFVHNLSRGSCPLFHANVGSRWPTLPYNAAILLL